MDFDPFLIDDLHTTLSHTLKEKQKPFNLFSENKIFCGNRYFGSI